MKNGVRNTKGRSGFSFIVFSFVSSILFVDKSFSAESEFITLSCPVEPYIVNAHLKGSVKTTGNNFIYSYNVLSDENKKQPLAMLVFDNIDADKVISYSGWSLCINYPKFRKVVCTLPVDQEQVLSLTVQSKIPPSVITYGLQRADSDTDSLSPETVKRLLPYYNNDAGALSEAIQESIASQCIGTGLPGPLKKFSDVIVGPSKESGSVASEKGEIIPTTPSDSGYEAAAQKKFNESVAAAKTITLVDSAGQQRGYDGNGPLFDNSGIIIDKVKTSDIPCNVKGLIVEATSISGEKVRQGIHLSSDDCQHKESTFNISTIRNKY